MSYRTEMWARYFWIVTSYRFSFRWNCMLYILQFCWIQKKGRWKPWLNVLKHAILLHLCWHVCYINLCLLSVETYLRFFPPGYIEISDVELQLLQMRSSTVSNYNQVSFMGMLVRMETTLPTVDEICWWSLCYGSLFPKNLNIEKSWRILKIDFEWWQRDQVGLIYHRSVVSNCNISHT